MSNLNLGLSLIEKYCIYATGVIEAFVHKVNQEPPIPELMHYTNDIGLAGIIESKKLRFTDVFDVNDPSEIKHGFSHAIQILNNLARNKSPLVMQFAERFEALYKDQLDRTAHYYICSFSKVIDDLGQWRSYADDGKGYALVFDGKVIEDHFVHHAPLAKDHNSTFSMHYNDKEVSEIQASLISSMFELISFPLKNKLTEDQFNIYMRTLSRELSARLLHISLFFKHEAYKHENEFRFLQIYRGDIPAPDIKLRPRKYEMVEYKEFDWSEAKSNALKKIIIGPAADVSKATMFAKYYLDKAEIKGVVIETSNIPYRSF